MLHFPHKINVIFILNIRNESLTLFEINKISQLYYKLKNNLFYNIFNAIRQLKHHNLTKKEKRSTFFFFIPIHLLFSSLIEAAATTASHLSPLTKQSVSIGSTIIHMVADKTRVIHRSKDQTASLCTSV